MTTVLDFAAKTDTGLVRSQNEDAIAIRPEYGFAVLADGMGGHNAGEVASAIAVDATIEVVEQGLRAPVVQIPHLLDSAFQRANAAILEAACSEQQYQGMGTTLVAALFHDEQVTVAHVGDSRVYRVRNSELVQLTRDHSLLQEHIDAGLVEPALAHLARHKNLVTRAVGVAEAMEVELHQYPVEAGDIYLLCSDGLSDMVDAVTLQKTLSAPREATEICEALVQMANDNGGLDNVSAIVIRVEAIKSEGQGLFERFLNWAM